MFGACPLALETCCTVDLYIQYSGVSMVFVCHSPFIFNNHCSECLFAFLSHVACSKPLLWDLLLGHWARKA